MDDFGFKTLEQTIQGSTCKHGINLNQQRCRLCQPDFFEQNEHGTNLQAIYEKLQRIEKLLEALGPQS